MSTRRLRHQTSGRWKLGLALALVATLLWGTLPIALKIVVVKMEPVTVIFYRFLIASLILGWQLRRKGHLPRLTDAGRGTLLVFGIAIAGCAGNNLIFLMGLQYITPSAAQVVVQLAPAFLLLGAVAIFKESFSRTQWIGFIVLIGGLLLFFNQRLGELFTGEGDYGLGVLLIVVATVFWAAFGLAQKQLLSKYRSGSILWTIYTVGCLGLLAGANPSQILRLDWLELLVLFYCGLNTLLGYGSFGESLAHWETSRASAVVATTPLLTVGLMEIVWRIMPAYVAPEHLNAASIAGAGLVVIGSILAAVMKKRGRVLTASDG